jgi:fatty acid desaturase
VIWVEVLAVFLVSHLVGDFALQTEWQAQHKRGGLGRDRTARRALLTHVMAYMAAFVPAFAWLLLEEVSVGIVAAIAAIIFVTHLIEDDGRLLERYIRSVKHTEAADHPTVTAALDQSFHVIVLFGMALLAVA